MSRQENVSINASNEIVPFGRPLIDNDEKQAVLDVLNGHVLTHGPKCKEFEHAFESFIGGGHAVTTSSCMASLHLSSLHFGLKPGDEVIVPAQTHVATVHAVELVGATPVFVDCELETGNIDIDIIEGKITDKTKAIFLVHFAGIPVNMERINIIATKHNLIVIEDCALAIGAFYKGKHVGLWGDTGCYSFYPVKHITTGEGGMLVSKNEATAKAIENFRAFSVDRTHNERKLPGVYDVNSVGLNYRMSEIQAAIGCVQLNKIGQILETRRNNFVALKNMLKDLAEFDIILDSKSEDCVNSHYCLIAILSEKLRDKRNEIILELKERGIGCSVYYPKPVPRMDYYARKYKIDSQEFVNAAIISDGSIALPVGPHLGLKEMELIYSAFKEIFV
jgi:dTDP-4-amino-4,6-dideoxygalactose transaminase